MSVACPNCGSRYLRPSKTRNFAEQLGLLRFKSPLRCLDCKTRFTAPTFVWSDLFYARCPMCRRMDLNGWTGNTYTDPPAWVAFKVALGARKWRCEYCRLNFASFRRRKEVFTFKRWKRFVPQAEEHAPPVENAPENPDHVQNRRAAAGN
jgi:DNA-directed RNA polymerase subunit RPC12/RpoP